MTKNDKRKHMESGLMNHIVYLLNFSWSLSQKISSLLETAGSRNQEAHESMEVDLLQEMPTDFQQPSRQHALASRKRLGKVVHDSSPDQRYASLPSEMPSSSRIEGDYSKVIDDITGKIEAIKLDFEDKLERLRRSFDAMMDSVKRLERRVTSYENVERSISQNMADLSESLTTWRVLTIVVC